MSIKAMFDDICKSELYRLVYEGKILGMRAKVYNKDTNTFDYYDFATNLISDKQLQGFLKDNKNKFSPLELLEFKDKVTNPDGSETINITLMTQEEVDNKQLISEFKDKQEAEKVLNFLKKVYEVKEG